MKCSEHIERMGELTALRTTWSMHLICDEGKAKHVTLNLHFIACLFIYLHLRLPVLDWKVRDEGGQGFCLLFSLLLGLAAVGKSGTQ